MSHQPERTDKNCLNCGTEVIGRYCHVCGQENIVTHQGFWSLTRHFIYDVLHFDGKFYNTLVRLFAKPGLVAKEYVQGKRMRYLDPIRMYLFTSAVFFLVFFSVNSLNSGVVDVKTELTNKDRIEIAEDLEKKMKPGDTVMKNKLAALKDTSRQMDFDSLYLPKKETIIGNYTSVLEYDSVQQSLPADKKDNWLKQRFIKQGIKLNKKYSNDPSGASAFFKAFLHQLPYILFLSLPFFALILKLLYIRRKNFYYSDHAVFTLYHYVLSFLLLLFIFAFNALQNWLGWGVFGVLVFLLIFSWPVYLYLQMRNFYSQGWFRTLTKFLLLNVLAFTVMILLFILFLLFAIFQI